MCVLGGGGGGGGGAEWGRIIAGRFKKKNPACSPGCLAPFYVAIIALVSLPLKQYIGCTQSHYTTSPKATYFDKTL